MPCLDKHKTEDMGGLCQNGFHILALIPRTVANMETVHAAVTKQRRHSLSKIVPVSVLFVSDIYITVCESACREGKCDLGCTHQTSDSVCKHCGSGVSRKHWIFTMTVSQNTLNHSVNNATILLNPKFPVPDKDTCKHEMHNFTRQKVCVMWYASLCMEKSVEEKLVLEKKVRKRLVKLANIFTPWLIFLSKSSCKYESCCSREMSERADEVPVTSSGDKTGIPADKMLCDFIQLGFRISDSDKVVKEEEMDHTQFRDQRLHMMQDRLQYCQLSICHETLCPSSEKRHDSDESSIPESIPCTSNPTSDLCTSIDYTHYETWSADPLTCSVLEGMPTVSGPERSLSPQNERGPCLLSTPEEDRTQSCEDTLVNTDFQINTNLPFYQGTDELTCLSKKSTEFAAECSSFRVTTKSKCDDHETEKLTAFIKMEEEESTEKRKAFIKMEDGSTEKRTAFIKSEQEEGRSLAPWPSPYSKEKKEEKDKDGKKENVDDVNCLSWMWQGPNIFPRVNNIVVAMLGSSPSRMDFHHSGMENEWNRLKSYNLFTPPEGIFVLRLASAGFFLYTGGEGKTPEQASVKCAFCKVIIVMVEFIKKAVMGVHRERSPSCRFVLGEDVGNVSATQITERSSKEFLHELDCSFPSFGKSPGPSSRNAASITAGGLQGGKVDLAVDCCPDTTTTVDRAPLDPKGHNLPACGGAVSGNSRTPPPPPLANPEQPSRPAVVASSSAATATATATAETATASSTTSQRQEPNRPAASISFASQTVGSSTPAPAPPQTATVQQPQAQLTGNAIHQPAGNASSSASLSVSSASLSAANRPPASPANPPAVSAAGSNLTAGEVMMDGVSGGTARQEPPQEPAQEPPSPAVLSGGNVGSGRGSGDRTGGEDGRPQDRQLVTYDELGIFTQQPKRPDMVVKTVRVNTFERWPHTESHPAEEMAEAGFYYTGHEDLVRCFHCKGGLKTWERSDKPWVEHSRWFPRCPFVRLAKGPKFVDAVQKLNNPQTRPAISEEDVEREIRRMEDEERLGLTPSVTLLSAIPPPSPDSDPTLGPLARAALRINADVTEASLSDMAEQLEDENEEMRDSIRCKMCQMNNVNVLFLPCGHLVACTQCAPALRRCAMCRAAVKGSVHVYMDDCHGNRDGNSGTGSQGTTAS